MCTDWSLVMGRWSFVFGNIALVICVSALGVCQAEPPDRAVDAKGPPRDIRFVLDDKPFIVETDQAAIAIRYAAIIRGFASYLVGNVRDTRNALLDTIEPNGLQALSSFVKSPASKRIERYLAARAKEHSFFYAFRGTNIDDYDAGVVEPPPGKHVSFSPQVGFAIAGLKNPSFDWGIFAPARELEHPPLQEYVFLAQSVEEAQSVARDFLELYDDGLLGRLRKLAHDGKERFTGERDEEAPKLADLTKLVVKEAKRLEGVEPLGEAAFSDLKVKRTLLKVDLAGVKARLKVIDKKLNGEPPPEGTILTRLSDLKVTAEIDLASLAAQQQSLDDLIDDQNRLSKLVRMQIQQSQVRNIVTKAESVVEISDEILADLLPFQLVNETVEIRPVKFAVPGETPPSK